MGSVRTVRYFPLTQFMKALAGLLTISAEMAKKSPELTSGERVKGLKV